MNILKRKETPSFSHRNKREAIPHPKIKKNISIDPNKLILPPLKDNIESNHLKNKYVNKIKSSKPSGKNRLSIDYTNKNILSPVSTELDPNKKRNSVGEEDSSKYLIKIHGKNACQLNNHKKKNHINSCKDVNNFNKNNRIKNINNINNIKTEFFPMLYSNNNNNNCNIKFPLIETNLHHMKSDEKKNNEIIRHIHHKYQSDTLLDINHVFQNKKYATYSRKGTEENGNDKENNQDNSIILCDVCDIENYCIYGIMDGHGSNGHLVSSFVKEKIKEYFTDKKIYRKKKLNKAVSSKEVKNSDKIYVKLIHNDYEIIKNFYKKVNDDLYNTKFDVHFSGTTCVLLFKVGTKIICSNVGDSRAILVKENINIKNTDTNYEFIELSHDHKPENKEERERIEKLGGEVAQEYLIGSEDKPTGPFRVWCKGYDYPGIAISRSLGDKIAELIGVIADPDILEFDLDDNSKYIIMGSDGLFDYLSNNEIMNIGSPFLNENNLDKACLEIVEQSAKVFKEKEKRIDDITINIIII